MPGQWNTSEHPGLRQVSCDHITSGGCHGWAIKTNSRRRFSGSSAATCILHIYLVDQLNKWNLQQSFGGKMKASFFADSRLLGGILPQLVVFKGDNDVATPRC